MSTVFAEISMSLDGYVTAPGATATSPLGKGGERLHEWVNTPEGQDVLAHGNRSLGAVICGRRTYQESLPWWGPDGVTGARRLPMFVLTNRPGPDTDVYHFTQGPAATLSAARTTAGDQDIAIMGGAETIRLFLTLGVVDELCLHLAPLVLGGGVPLFQNLTLNLTPLDVVHSPAATHLRYRLT